LADQLTTEFSLIRPLASPPGPAPAPPGFDVEQETEVPEAGIEDPAPVLAAAVPSPGPAEAEARPAVRPALPWAEAGLSPGALQRDEGDTDPRLLTVRLTSTGDAQRDARRLRRVHGLLQSYPGSDRFVFHVFEAARQYHLEFPNSTTGACRDLFHQLTLLLGEGAVAVERLRLQ
jgi:hypothetical protein